MDCRRDVLSVSRDALVDLKKGRTDVGSGYLGISTRPEFRHGQASLLAALVAYLVVHRLLECLCRESQMREPESLSYLGPGQMCVYL